RLRHRRCAGPRCAARRARAESARQRREPDRVRGRGREPGRLFAVARARRRLPAAALPAEAAAGARPRAAKQPRGRPRILFGAGDGCGLAGARGAGGIAAAAGRHCRHRRAAPRRGLRRRVHRGRRAHPGEPRRRQPDRGEKNSDNRGKEAGMTPLDGLTGGLGLLILGIAVIAVILYLVPIPLWIAAWASGAYVGLFTLIAMRLRRVPPGTVVTARISAVKAGIDISLNDLEAHYLAGGDVVRVVNAMISADKANIPLPFKRAAAIDLAGRNVFEAVQMSVLPKVIETPRIAAVAKHGIQLIAVSRVTVRANIDRLVGGAGEETVIARVGEGMVSTIG